MDVKIGERWRTFLENAVAGGRYASAEDVVSEGLRLLAEREGRLEELRGLIDEAYADDGLETSEDVRAALKEAIADELTA